MLVSEYFDLLYAYQI